MATAKYVWMNGKLVDYQNATVHFVRAGVQYGLSVFEGIRCYSTDEGPAVFRLQEHVDRLFDSAHILGMNELPYTPEQMSEPSSRRSLPTDMAIATFGQRFIPDRAA